MDGGSQGARSRDGGLDHLDLRRGPGSRARVTIGEVDRLIVRRAALPIVDKVVVTCIGTNPIERRRPAMSGRARPLAVERHSKVQIPSAEEGDGYETVTSDRARSTAARGSEGPVRAGKVPAGYARGAG